MSPTTKRRGIDDPPSEAPECPSPKDAPTHAPIGAQIRFLLGDFKLPVFRARDESNYANMSTLKLHEDT
jgi:hypothetical protein